MNTKKWTTKDGQRIRIKDMEDSHLLNTIRFLERTWEKRKASMLSDFPCFNGEMAQYYAEQEWDRLADTDIEEACPIYNDMVDEAERRNLLKGANNGERG